MGYTLKLILNEDDNDKEYQTSLFDNKDDRELQKILDADDNVEDEDTEPEDDEESGKLQAVTTPLFTKYARNYKNGIYNIKELNLGAKIVLDIYKRCVLEHQPYVTNEQIRADLGIIPPMSFVTNYYHTELSKIKDAVDSQKDMAKSQLDKGLINQYDYNTAVKNADSYYKSEKTLLNKFIQDKLKSSRDNITKPFEEIDSAGLNRPFTTTKVTITDYKGVESLQDVFVPTKYIEDYVTGADTAQGNANTQHRNLLPYVSKLDSIPQKMSFADDMSQRNTSWANANPTTPASKTSTTITDQDTGDYTYGSAPILRRNKSQKKNNTSASTQTMDKNVQDQFTPTNQPADIYDKTTYEKFNPSLYEGIRTGTNGDKEHDELLNEDVLVYDIAKDDAAINRYNEYKKLASELCVPPVTHVTAENIRPWIVQKIAGMHVVPCEQVTQEILTLESLNNENQ